MAADSLLRGLHDGFNGTSGDAYQLQNNQTAALSNVLQQRIMISSAEAIEVMNNLTKKGKANRILKELVENMKDDE